MRQGPHQKRGRGRGNRRPSTPNRNQTFDSNGPDVRIRGNASQVYEKYLNLARDATASGDRVLAESYFQHAEHYYRIIAAAQAQMPFPQQQVFRNSDDNDDDGEEFGNLPQQQVNNPQQPQGQPGQFRREGEQQPGYAAEGQPAYGGNGHAGPAPGVGDQPMVGAADGEGDDDMMESALPNGGGGQPQGQGHGQGQFRRRRRPHRGGGGGRPDYRDGGNNNFNPGPQGGGSDE
jgi:hypothetical protein